MDQDSNGQPSPPAESSSNGPAAAPMPEFKPLSDYVAPTPAAAVKGPLAVEPFSADEIVGGAAFMMIVGFQMQSEREAAAFQEAFQWMVKPIFPTAKVVEQLRLGEALAHYGVGRGMGLGLGLENLPPLARIACGAVALGAAGFMAYRAVQFGPKGGIDEQVEDASVGLGGAGSGSGDSRGPESDDGAGGARRVPD